MPDFAIPPSLRSYFQDSEVETAVTALIDKLDGSDMPVATLKQAREYNMALLMAAQVRTDYVDLFFRIWDATWGQASLQQLGRVAHDADDLSPEFIWANAYIGQQFQRGSSTFNLYVSDEDGGGVRLQAYWPKALGVSVSNVSAASSAWGVLEDDEDLWAATTTPIMMTDLLDQPDGTLAAMRSAALQLVQILSAQRSAVAPH